MELSTYSVMLVLKQFLEFLSILDFQDRNAWPGLKCSTRKNSKGPSKLGASGCYQMKGDGGAMG